VNTLLTPSCVPVIVIPDNTVVSELTVTVTTLPDIDAVTAEPTKFIPVAAEVIKTPSSYIKAIGLVPEVPDEPDVPELPLVPEDPDVPLEPEVPANPAKVISQLQKFPDPS
jgi:hypothetical protein